jgi:class 3 adenylate cyclase
VELLTRFLQEISTFVDVRFKELYALLELMQEINRGLLFDEILEKAYETLRLVLPYDRLSVALIDDDGETARACWARSDYPDLMLRVGYAGPLEGSSLREIISSGEPRIINNLASYLEMCPDSASTRLMVAEGIRSSLTCPLISTGKPLGFIFFSSRTPDTYKDVHVEIFKLIAGHLSVVLEKSNLYQQVLQEKEKSDRLLLNVVPARIAARLRAGDQSVVEDLPEISILFADIVDFTEFAGRYPPEVVVDFLQNIFVRMDRLCDEYAVEKIKTIGDEYMVISSSSDSPGDKQIRNLAEFALAVLRMIEGIRFPDGRQVRLRIGMQTGHAVAGVIGQKKFAYDIWGDAVNVASRMESSGRAGCIHVAREVYLCLRDEFLFEERDIIAIKGKGPMKTYFLTGKINHHRPDNKAASASTLSEDSSLTTVL